MISRVIIYGIIIGIILFILIRKIKKHLILLSIIAILALLVSVAAPTMNDFNALVDDAKLIGTYENIGRVYYDENDNMYFVISINPWDLFESIKKTAIDYNLGEMTHIVSDIINDAEHLLENYN